MCNLVEHAKEQLVDPLHAKPAYLAMKENKAAYLRLARYIPLVPVRWLTVGELNFLNENVGMFAPPSPVFFTTGTSEQMEIQFYTESRNQQLLSILMRCEIGIA